MPKAKKQPKIKDKVKTDILDLAEQVCLMAVALAEETENCGICGGESDHTGDCPYPKADEFLVAIGKR